MSSDIRFEIVVIHLLVQADKHLGPHALVHEDAEGVVGACGLIDFTVVEKVGKLVLQCFQMLPHSGPHHNLVRIDGLAGAVAGSLVPRFGWLFGLLTQILKMLILLMIASTWAFLVASDPEVDLSTVLLRAPFVRLMLFAMITAAIGGGVGERYRSQTMSFLASTFGFVAGGIGCATYVFGFTIELDFMYLGGKALFEDGAIIKALYFVFLVGPIVSVLIPSFLMGILMLCVFVFEKLHAWYAPDLGLDPLDSV